MKHLSILGTRCQRLGLFFILLAAAFCPQADLRAQAHQEHRPNRANMAAAQAQEAALTRDPTTGTVPRERLLQAKAVMTHLLQDQPGARLRNAAAGGSLSLANWTEKGPSNIGGRVLALLPDPSDSTGNTVWAGTADGGLWKTTTAAQATPIWAPVNDFFANLAVSTLAYDPSSAGNNTMYFGTGEGYFNFDAVRGLGIWKSTDHGATWAQLPSTNNADFYYVQKIVVDVQGWVYAATHRGLRRSRDGGATWEGVLFDGSGRFSDVDINPATGAVYASVGIFQGGGIFYSPSGNAGTFTNLNASATSGLPASSAHYRVEVAIAPSDPTRLYALFCATDYSLLNAYRSSDGGATWTMLPRPVDADPGIGRDFTRQQAWYDLTLEVSPTDPNTVFIGGVDVFKSADAGASWQQATHWYGGRFNGVTYQYLHADQHAIAFAPGSGTRAYFGNDGGFAGTADATAPTPTVTTAITNLNVTQFYSVAVHPTDVNYFLAGAQDNGTQQFGVLSGQQTRDVVGGDGAFCFIDQNQPQYQFATYVYSNIYRSSQGGLEAGGFAETLLQSNTGSFINPMDYDSALKTLYFGFGDNTLGRIIRATGPIGDAATGPLRSTIALPPGSGTVTHVSVSPNVANRLYVGTNTGRVLRIDNADGSGAAPAITLLYSDAFPNVSISCVGVEPEAPGAATPDQHLVVSLANYGVTSVQQSTDSGTTWASAEGNLPDMPVRWVLLDSTAGKRALLATELGVWSTDDLTAASIVWNPSNTNLANVRVDMLRLRPADRQVAAATHGRGLFTSDVLIPAPLPEALTAFTATAQGPAAVRVAWTTDPKHHSGRFELERSLDGTHFSVLGTVGGAGNRNAAHAYAWMDEPMPAGAGPLYYRLRYMDQNGKATLSPVRAVARRGRPGDLTLAPNPARATTLAGLAAGAPVGVYDALGRLVFSATADASGRAALGLPAWLPAGMYVVRSGNQAVRLEVE